LELAMALKSRVLLIVALSFGGGLALLAWAQRAGIEAEFERVNTYLVFAKFVHAGAEAGLTGELSTPDTPGDQLAKIAWREPMVGGRTRHTTCYFRNGQLELVHRYGWGEVGGNLDFRKSHEERLVVRHGRLVDQLSGEAPKDGQELRGSADRAYEAVSKKAGEQ
jgi:hypothetical protein